MISPEIFLKVNNIHQGSVGYRVPHKKEQDAIPLKIFIKCDTCNLPFTGYVVKAKSLWYYKCRKDGCKCNKSAKKMHELFEQLLSLAHLSGNTGINEKRTDHHFDNQSLSADYWRRSSNQFADDLSEIQVFLR